MSTVLPRFLTDPDVERHLLRDEGEVVIDEVRKHWVVYVLPTIISIGGLALLAVVLFSPVHSAWLPLLVAFGLLGWAGWMAADRKLDRFVITNLRVFRINGVLSRTVATMPLTRILDITVQQPLHGRLLGFGHFVFETAAQDQGLREITYVPRPHERDLVIQGIVQRAGLRRNGLA